jgi:uncharacterized ferritin-like protein (DUF455 family)
MELRQRALQALCTANPLLKAALARELPAHGATPGEGLAALLHAIAHIEFNAIKKVCRSISSRIAQRGGLVP